MGYFVKGTGDVRISKENLAAAYDALMALQDAPDETLSSTPSLASCNASLPATVSAILAVNNIPSGVSVREVTRPTGCDES